MMRIKNFHFSSFLLHSYFLLFIALCGQFLYGRTLQANSAFSLFKLINSNQLQTDLADWTRIFDHVLPYFSIKMGLPLLIVLFLYCIGFPLLCYTVWIIIHHIIKAKESSWLVSIPAIFYSEITAFDMSASAIYALLFFLAFWSIKLSNTLKRKDIFLLFLFALSAMSHPLICLVQMILISSIFLIKKERITNKPLPYIIIILASLLFWLQVYDWQPLTTVDPGKLEKIIQIPVFGKWFIVSVIFILIIPFFSGVRKSQDFLVLKGSLSLILICFCAYFFLSAAPWQKANQAIFLLLLICAIYILFSFDTKWNRWIWIPMILAVFNIWQQGNFLEKKFTYYDNLKWSLREQNHQKYLITEDELKYSSLQSWALSIETLLYSASNRKIPYTFYQCKTSEIQSLLKTDKDEFLQVPFYLKIPSKNLNPNYFSLESEPYFTVSDTIPQNPSQNMLESN